MLDRSEILSGPYGGASTPHIVSVTVALHTEGSHVRVFRCEGIESAIRNTCEASERPPLVCFRSRTRPQASCCTRRRTQLKFSLYSVLYAAEVPGAAFDGARRARRAQGLFFCDRPPVATGSKQETATLFFGVYQSVRSLLA